MAVTIFYSLPQDQFSPRPQNSGFFDFARPRGSFFRAADNDGIDRPRRKRKRRRKGKAALPPRELAGEEGPAERPRTKAKANAAATASSSSAAVSSLESDGSLPDDRSARPRTTSRAAAAASEAADRELAERLQRQEDRERERSLRGRPQGTRPGGE